MLELVATPDPDVEGAIEITVTPADDDGVQALGIGFVAEQGERFVGFGERSNAVDQNGWALEHYVADGPYYDSQEYAVMGEVLPPWGTRWRPDTTYFPIPWLLSSRGYGVLIDNDEISYHRVGSESPDAWSLEVETTRDCRFRVFGGPTPAEALGRYTEAVGRQPSNYAPWFFGPWLQTEERHPIEEARLADVPTSLNATYLHYLPCGSQQGREEAQSIRTSANHDMGVAIHTYFNPMICVTYDPPFSGARRARGADQARRRSDVHLRLQQQPRQQLRGEPVRLRIRQRRRPRTRASPTRRSTMDTTDGWKTSASTRRSTRFRPTAPPGPSSTTATRATTIAACTKRRRTLAGRSLGSLAPAGRAHRACTPIVWGGDPTTGYDYDGLRSSIYRALSMGTSGVGIWGSDIGGFFAMFGRSLRRRALRPLDRVWRALDVMRSQKNGVQVPEYDRPQPWDPDHLPIWRQYSKLHTQLYPYIQAAAEEYYATGRPIMQHHILTHPDDANATGRDDQYMFGPDILVAPVYMEGATERELYLPEGVWVEWWRSVRYGEEGGTFSLGAAVLRDGGQSAMVAAPISEIPMFVEAGAVIPMLWPDVFTLAEYGDDPEIVHASDRNDLLHVLAFPRGEIVRIVLRRRHLDEH